MTPAEALRVLAEVKTAWPAMALPDPTVKAWAFDLVEFDAEDARTAVHDLARFQARPPALAELIDACREARATRAQTRMLPEGRPTVDGAIGFKDWLATQPPEMHERVRKVFPRWVHKALG